MHINSRKALILLVLFSSCSVVFTPKSAQAAQTTFPTITVVGRPPQSQAQIQQLLDQIRQPSLLLEFAELVELVDMPEYPQTSLTLYTTDCRASQEVRTNAVTQALSIPGSPTYLAFGTEVTVNYMNGNASERFVVTGGGGGSGDPGRALTPVAGSLVCH